MPAEQILLTVDLRATITEVLAASVVPLAQRTEERQVSHSSGGVTTTITAQDTPHATACLALAITFDEGGAYELNLAAAPTTGAGDGGEDLSGKRLLLAQFETPSDNQGAVLITADVDNGYGLFGATFKQSLPKHSNALHLWRGQQLPAISSTARVIRFEGSEGDKIHVKLAFE